ncbi:alkaline phosphatase family protein [Halopenitus persicus]|uniref:Sulfatase n=1 Tax=Halopenitus persicus TaxID=1048396 RepID=A0A1H3IZR8_9EURY|nr:hypothetical protein [Halopenitus persicus]SDY32845.1 hypothetical protein SAMN05216564_104316 [Halopenitus persicus]
MKGFSKVRTGIKNPKIALVYGYGTFRNRIFGGNDGTYVLDEDWDNLIILDACRYDLFEDVNDLPGELSSVRSRGSHTGEFMEQNFGGGSFQDVVYVSANPHPAEVNAEFHAVKQVWENGWDEELHTVPPEPVVEATLEMASEYPNKRLITHFLQPHYPFIGEEGRRFHEEYGYTSLDQPDNIWLRMRRGEIDRERVWDVYRENLTVVLPYVAELLEKLEGKTVVTSDHGNAFGEWGIYGHPGSAYIDPLVTVPWLIANSKNRKSVETGETTDRMSLEEDVSDRLEQLGYT